MTSFTCTILKVFDGLSATVCTNWIAKNAMPMFFFKTYLSQSRGIFFGDKVLQPE
jgi:hypothetical protein